MFQGEVKLVGEPYQETQSDIHGKRRKVWIFPLKLINGNPTPITCEQFEAMNKKRAMRAKGLSIEELKKE